MGVENRPRGDNASDASSGGRDGQGHHNQRRAREAYGQRGSEAAARDSVGAVEAREGSAEPVEGCQLQSRLKGVQEVA